MRFLIQKIDKEITHDFSFILLESIRYHKWLQGDDADVQVKYLNCKANDGVWFFKPYHQHYVPVGSVEFVLSWMKRFGVPVPKPINVPEELFDFADRGIFNGPHYDMDDILDKRFVKSNDHIKGFKEVIDNTYDLPEGNYQFSEVIDIKSEWRAFVYKGELVGLQNYGGDFTSFPDIRTIGAMIRAYQSAPIAYTLDVGVEYGWSKTFVIECHDFFSCGLYGFAEHKIYPYMLYRWFHEYLTKNNQPIL
jgi:hypothetical protein